MSKKIYVRPGNTREVRKEQALDLFRKLSGREPTDQELSDLDQRAASGDPESGSQPEAETEEPVAEPNAAE